MDGLEVAENPCPYEIDISFPLKTFASLKEDTPEEKLDDVLSLFFAGLLC